MSTNIKKCEFKVDGMHCAACELLIENKLSKLEGIKSVDAKLSSNKVIVEVEEDKLNEELVNDMNKLINENGYKIEKDENHKKVNYLDYLISFLIALLIGGILLVLQKLDLFNVLNSSEFNLGFVFLIGVVASLSTCMAVVGGLVLSISTTYAKNGRVKAITSFHISRLIGFFFLGGLVGLVGSVFKLTTITSALLSLFLVIIMIMMALNLLGFNRFQLRLPKKFGKGVLKISEEGKQKSSLIIPILLGLLTFILPCGFTQSMQVYALESGSFISGALIMFVFALGTLPVLALVSFATIKFSKSLQSGIFFKTTGFLILFFCIFNIIGVLTTLGILNSL